MIIDITPRIFTFNGNVIELGTVRYNVDNKVIGDRDFPAVVMIPPTALDYQWPSAKIEFKVESKPEQLQPTPISAIEIKPNE